MNHKISITKNTIAAAAGVGFAVLSIIHYQLPIAPALAQAAPGQLFITWRALNFYPANFAGKALPTFNSPIIVAVEAAQGGTLIDLSQMEIQWELDGKFLAGGRGMKQTNFITSKGAGDTHFVHVSLARGRESIQYSLRIPVAEPAVIIDAPYPERQGTGNTMVLRALPFFFTSPSLSKLSFSWTIDGERRNVESDTELVVSGSSLLEPRTFRASLRAQNLQNLAEVASTEETFLIAP